MSWLRGLASVPHLELSAPNNWHSLRHEENLPFLCNLLQGVQRVRLALPRAKELVDFAEA